MATRGSYVHISMGEFSGASRWFFCFMQFSTKIDGFEQSDSQGFENSYNSYEQYLLEKFLIFTIYQNYTLALKAVFNNVSTLKIWAAWLYIMLSVSLKNLHFKSIIKCFKE